jgi:hypothetical protein
MGLRYDTRTQPDVPVVDGRFWVGVRNGLLIVAPFWFGVAWLIGRLT